VPSIAAGRRPSASDRRCAQCRHRGARAAGPQSDLCGRGRMSAYDSLTRTCHSEVFARPVKCPGFDHPRNEKNLELRRVARPLHFGATGFNATLLNELLGGWERCGTGGRWQSGCFRFRRLGARDCGDTGGRWRSRRFRFKRRCSCTSSDFNYLRLWSRQWWLLLFEYSLFLRLHNRRCGRKRRRRGRPCLRHRHGH
jgi:hypothetical protein